jgi:hypothetical protein
MSACHTKPFVASGVLIAPISLALSSDREPPAELSVEACDYCGASTLEWRKCKLICTSCKQINKSCADL